MAQLLRRRGPPLRAGALRAARRPARRAVPSRSSPRCGARGRQQEAREAREARGGGGERAEGGGAEVVARSASVYAAEEALSESALLGQVVGLALPALFALAIDPLLTVADSAFVGRVSTEALGALGVASAVFALCFKVFSVTLSVVVAPVVTTDVAAGDVGRARRTVSDALALALCVGGAAALGVEIFAEDVLQLAGATPDSPLAEGALAYLRVRAAALPAALAGAVGVGAFRGALDTRTPLRVALAANALNATLDPLLIFGLPALGVPAFGLGGAAAATAAAEYLAAGWFIVLLAERELLDVGRVLSLGGLASWATGNSGSKGGEAAGDEAGGLSEVLAGGGGQLLRTLSIQALLFEATASAASLDAETSAAAHQCVLQVWYLSLFMLDALAVAAQGLVANELGRGNVAGARRVSNLILRMSLGFGGALALALGATGVLLPGVFTEDEAVAAAAAQPLQLVAALQPLNAVVFVGDGILQGAKDFGYVALAMGASTAAAGTALAAMGGSLLGVWQAIGVLQVSRAASLSIRYWGGTGPLALPDGDAKEEAEGRPE